MALEWQYAGILHEWLGDTVKAFTYDRKSLDLARSHAGAGGEFPSKKGIRATSMLLLQGTNDDAGSDMALEYPAPEEAMTVDRQDTFVDFLTCTRKTDIRWLSYFLNCST